MTTVLFRPVTFNLAETTRMIRVTRALDDTTRSRRCSWDAKTTSST
jgi:hypothetical protein